MWQRYSLFLHVLCCLELQVSSVDVKPAKLCVDLRRNEILILQNMPTVTVIETHTHACTHTHMHAHTHDGWCAHTLGTMVRNYIQNSGHTSIQYIRFVSASTVTATGTGRHVSTSQVLSHETSYSLRMCVLGQGKIPLMHVRNWCAFAASLK